MSQINYKNLVLEELNYNSYLKIPELLNLQQQISSPPHHDEMFFIIIHQTAELWFKEVLHETETLVQAFKDGVISHALKTLKRITAIMALQADQIRLLSTLTPAEFAGFRDHLKPASGFQSAQYRIIEFTYGVRNTFFLKFFESIPAVAARLAEIQTQPSVYDTFIQCIHKSLAPLPAELLERDFSQPRECSAELVAVIKQAYIHPRDDNYHWVLMFEALMDLDEQFTIWRKNHAVMVHRTIGDKQGTGGSAGFQFLKSREDLQAFPELWEVRNQIGGDY